MGGPGMDSGFRRKDEVAEAAVYFHGKGNPGVIREDTGASSVPPCSVPGHWKRPNIWNRGLSWHESIVANMCAHAQHRSSSRATAFISRTPSLHGAHRVV